MASRKRLILAREAICAASHYQMSYRLNRRDLDLPRVVLLKSRLTVAISNQNESGGPITRKSNGLNWHISPINWYEHDGLFGFRNVGRQS